MIDSRRIFNVLPKTFKGYETIIIFLIKIFTQFSLHELSVRCYLARKGLPVLVSVNFTEYMP